MHTSETVTTGAQAQEAPVTLQLALQHSTCNTLDAQRRLNAFYLREMAHPGSFAATPAPLEYAPILAV